MYCTVLYHRVSTHGPYGVGMILFRYTRERCGGIVSDASRAHLCDIGTCVEVRQGKVQVRFCYTQRYYPQ